MPRAATTRSSWSRIGTATDTVPRDISSAVRAYPRRLTSLSSRASRPGWMTEWRVARVRWPMTSVTTLSGACARSTLPTPVVCSGSREPTVLTTGTEVCPESRST